MAKTTETEGSVRGQKLVNSWGRDDSSMKLDDGESRKGRDMGGSTKNLSHSLSGSSAVQGVKKGG